MAKKKSLSPKLTIGTIYLMIFVLFSVLKVRAANNIFGVEARGVINLYAEGSILGMFVLILFLNLLVSRKLGNSIVSLPFIYILGGIVIEEAARILIILYEFEVYHIAEITLQIGWHYLFFLGMILFYVSLNRFAQRLNENDLHGFSKIDGGIFSVVFLLSIIGFLFIGSVNQVIIDNFQGSIYDSIGLIHFLAFLVAGILTFRLLRIRRKAQDSRMGKYIESIVPTFILFLTLMSLNHFWELITESWALVDLDEAIIETGEQLFWVLSFFTMFVGFILLNRTVNQILRSSEKEVAEVDIKLNDPVVTLIIDILSEHIGSLAVNIAITSSKQSGIELNKIDETNVSAFGDAVASNTKDLIGEFPSKFLNHSLQKAIKGQKPANAPISG